METQYPAMTAVPNQQQQQYDIPKYEQENKQYQQEIADLKARNENLANEFRFKTDQIQKAMEAKLALFLPILKTGGDLGANLFAANEENNRLKAELMQKNQYISQLEGQNGAAQQEIQRLNIVIQQTQAAFNQQKQQDKNIIYKLEQNLANSEHTIRNAHSEISSLKSDIQSQKQKISRFESEISSLRNDLKKAQTQATHNKLNSDQSLKQGEFITSKSGNYKAIMQEDANFVIYDQFNKPVWATDSYRTNVRGPYHVRMQTDGNLVIYGSANQVVWASDTYQKGAGGSYLVLQDKGRLVIKDRNESEQWSSGAGK